MSDAKSPAKSSISADSERATIPPRYTARTLVRSESQPAIGLHGRTGAFGDHLFVQVDEHGPHAGHGEDPAQFSSAAAEISKPLTTSVKEPGCDPGIDVLDDEVLALELREP